ncbi:MAG: helix-turn-helix domain-containing protein [Bacteroidales bacterium]|nr:helix-turn-helix domain-containing protein [Bacteroidales bacterium]
MTTIVQLDINDLKPLIKDCFRESLEEIKQTTTEEDKPDKCSISEASEITGLKKSAIYQMTFKGTIPFKKFGRKLVFSREELQNWLDSKTIRKISINEIVTKQLQDEADKKALRYKK